MTGMSTLLRAEMIAVALLAVYIIVHNVNRKKLRIQYSFVWLLIALSMLGAALFPGAVSWLCGVLGLETPSNLIYLVAILVLMLISFFQTMLLSRQADQIERLIQIVSIEKFIAEGEGAGHEEEGSGH